MQARALRASLLALLAAGALGACHHAVEIATPKSDDPLAPPTSTKVDHEACDMASSSAEKLDANGDGRPDIVRVRRGEREVCRVIDLNHDGLPDAYIYFDEQSRERRRESDFDRDGRIDEIDTLVDGAVVRKDLETNLDGKLDTWKYYEGGHLVRQLRDGDGDGKVDEWWTWPDPAKDCPLVAYDRDGDGRADPGTETDMCADADAGPKPGASGAPAASAKPAAASSAAATPAPSASAMPASSAAPASSAETKGTK